MEEALPREAEKKTAQVSQTAEMLRRSYAWVWLAAISIVVFGAIFFFIREANLASAEIPAPPAGNLLPSEEKPAEIPTRPVGSGYTIDLGSGIQLEMVWIPNGSFIMGSPSGESGRDDDEGPQTNVRLEGFWMGRYEVTQAQYQAIMGTNPSDFSGANNPVERVSWNRAMEFSRKLSERTGENYTLPTEAQWEYACRAGTTSAYYFGNDSGQLENYAWFDSKYGGTTHPVGQKQPNGWGLYDMHGNVWEWCLSLYRPYPYSETDGRNSESYTSSARVLRGGSRGSNPENCRSAGRGRNAPARGVDGLGFRVVCSPRT
jgi:formylglycine-generating enzyme required for sulfatase activity